MREIRLSLFYKTPKTLCDRDIETDDDKAENEYIHDEEGIQFYKKCYFGATWVPVLVSKECFEYSKNYTDVSIETQGEIVLTKPAIGGDFYKSLKFITYDDKSPITELKYDHGIDYKN